MKHFFEHKYSIRDEIFYITPESDKGIIIDISYSIRHRGVKYEVVFGRQSSDCVWCYEDEITEIKTF